MAAPRIRRPLPVWPYYFLSAAAGGLGVLFLVVWWPAGYPDEGKLHKVSGDIASVVVRDEISDTGAGSMLPGMTSVYFRLEGVEEEFRFPSSHPKFPQVRDHTAVAMDVWVDKAEMGRGAPVTIWRLQERNPFNEVAEQTEVSYAEIVERLGSVDRAMTDLGYGLLAVCAGLLALGLGVGRRNRRRQA